VGVPRPQGSLPTGQVITETRRRHRSVEFRPLLGTTDAAVPPELDVHPVLDHEAPRKTEMIRRWRLERPRHPVRFTPTSSSWLNLGECWVSILPRRELARGVYQSTDARARAIRRSVAAANTEAKPLVGIKTADQLLASVERFCRRTSGSDRSWCPHSVELSRDGHEEHGVDQPQEGVVRPARTPVARGPRRGRARRPRPVPCPPRRARRPPPTRGSRCPRAAPPSCATPRGTPDRTPSGTAGRRASRGR
jgi:hypothetical protein